MTSDLFSRIGEALYGAHWKAQMAETLNVVPRTVQRLAAGKYPIPDYIPPLLGKLLAERALEIAALIGEFG